MPTGDGKAYEGKGETKYGIENAKVTKYGGCTEEQDAKVSGTLKLS